MIVMSRSSKIETLIASVIVGFEGVYCPAAGGTLLQFDNIKRYDISQGHLGFPVYRSGKINSLLSSFLKEHFSPNQKAHHRLNSEL